MAKKEEVEKLLIGAHISISGGVHNALLRGYEIGATTMQIFTSNQRQWSGKPIPEEEVQLWRECLQKTKIQKIMSHNNYLINLGSNNKELLTKSRKAFKEEIKRCLQLGLTFLNFHPGSATGSSEENCLETIAKSLLECEPFLKKSNLRFLIETTAGQGTSVGYRFEHLAYLIERVKGKIPVGVCIDTCHIFAAGYDIRTKISWDKTLKEFQKVVGLKYLYAFHVNDSVYPLGSRRDRHASLGKGQIGADCFKVMIKHPKMRNLPKYLETPLGNKMWKDEIAALRKFAKER